MRYTDCRCLAYSSGTFPSGLHVSSPASYLPIARDIAQVASRLEYLLPFWVTNGEAVTGLCLDTGEYVRFYYEDGGLQNPNDHVETLGTNYQQFAAHVIIETYDAALNDLLAEAGLF